MMKAAFFGAVSLDDITLPSMCLTKTVGGSAVYGALAGNLFCRTGMISVLGADFSKNYVTFLKQKGIDTSLLQKSKKPSFRWVAEYSSDLTMVKTINREPGAFADFDAKKLKGKLKSIKALFVSKNNPIEQLAVLKAAPKDTIRIMATRSNWITNYRENLKKALAYTDLFLIHDSELKLLVGESSSLPEMIEQAMHYGPKVIVLMRGEHGLVMYGSMGTMIVPSYPLAYAVDPTGAGDVFGGSLAGGLASLGKLTPSTMRKALILASMAASFVVEDYGTKALENLTIKEVVNRTKMFLHQLPTGVDVPMTIKNSRV
ncbi:hypothetical protein A3B57_02095 [Microgenomates group bacterium RIFCSPLOWO2_01_FULL_47_10]|nr:MAG: hypothetical protein A3B57_02095 [Microgenomates group bacterium RIFCSPLOWO2_01_FULL_47_10]